MNILKSLMHPLPEYVFRPSQIWLRLIREFNQRVHTYEDLTLPWGLAIRVRPAEAIGSCIWRLGIHDLCTSETIARLIDPGDLAVDVGANIGYMSSIMARRVGPQGRVIAFEPHPDIYNELEFNVGHWKDKSGIGSIVLYNMALSNQAGEGVLGIPAEFDINRGLAQLVLNSDTANTLLVNLGCLDEIMENEKIGLLKLDVEGYEENVLRGAERLLKHRLIRDIVFESYKCYPTPVTQLLEEHGYHIFELDFKLLGLTVRPAGSSHNQVRRSVDVPNYLATIDPARALVRLRKTGWIVLNTSLLGKIKVSMDSRKSTEGI